MIGSIELDPFSSSASLSIKSKDLIDVDNHYCPVVDFRNCYNV